MNDIPHKLSRHKELTEDIEQTKESIKRHKHEIKVAQVYLKQKEQQQEKVRQELFDEGFLV